MIDMHETDVLRGKMMTKSSMFAARFILELGLSQKNALKWKLKAPTVSKRGLILRIWAKMGPIGGKAPTFGSNGALSVSGRPPFLVEFGATVADFRPILAECWRNVADVCPEICQLWPM